MVQYPVEDDSPLLSAEPEEAEAPQPPEERVGSPEVFRAGVLVMALGIFVLAVAFSQVPSDPRSAAADLAATVGDSMIIPIIAGFSLVFGFMPTTLRTPADGRTDRLRRNYRLGQGTIIAGAVGVGAGFAVVLSHTVFGPTRFDDPRVWLVTFVPAGVLFVGLQIVAGTTTGQFWKRPARKEYPS